jgi:hypothetical protein
LTIKKEQSNNLFIGEEYLSSLRDKRESYINDEKTKDVYGCAWLIITSMAEMRGQLTSRSLEKPYDFKINHFRTPSITANFFELEGIRS